LCRRQVLSRCWCEARTQGSLPHDSLRWNGTFHITSPLISSKFSFIERFIETKIVLFVQVTYNVQNWLDKNTDTLFPDLKVLLQNSKIPFVAKLFPQEISTKQRPPTVSTQFKVIYLLFDFVNIYNCSFHLIKKFIHFVTKTTRDNIDKSYCCFVFWNLGTSCRTDEYFDELSSTLYSLYSTKSKQSTKTIWWQFGSQSNSILGTVGERPSASCRIRLSSTVRKVSASIQNSLSRNLAKVEWFSKRWLCEDLTSHENTVIIFCNRTHKDFHSWTSCSTLCFLFSSFHLFVVCCLLFFVCCLLFVVCCLLFVVCCLLFVVCCLLFVVCCLLFVVCCLLFVVEDP
jgi:hypothetical protein